MDKYNREILQLALPSVVSNITVPLLGLVDVAIAGHIGDATYIGAIAIGSMIFNIIYWVFGFLRMGTSGMTSQALGRRDLAEVMRTLVRALCVGVGVALCFVREDTSGQRDRQPLPKDVPAEKGVVCKRENISGSVQQRGHAEADKRLHSFLPDHRYAHSG